MRRTLLLAVTLVSVALFAAAPPPLESPAGMVAADHELASQAGAEILSRGGNAIDAAVATALASGVVQPAGSGLGGGGFAVISDGAEHYVLDFREVAPAAASPQMYLDEEGEVVDRLSLDGGLAVGVPGEGRGLASLLASHGTMSPTEVVRPAVRLASRGFPVGSHLHGALTRRPEMILLFDGLRELPSTGQLVRRRALARTLEAWARSRGEALYEGSIARDIVEATQATGGILSEQDLADYAPREREPLVGSYRGYTVVTMPPPSSGGAVLLQALAVLEGYDLAGLGHNSADHIHLLAEVFQHAYADRAAVMGDPDFTEVPLDIMLSPDRIQAIRRSVWPGRTFDRDSYGSGYALPEDAGTLHVSVMDGSGLGVALTTTINTSFGSRVVGARSGVLLNNEMDDFVVKAGVPNAYGLIGREANAVEPGKKPLSSMTPTLLLDADGRVVMAIGGSGGSYIISSTLQVLSNIVDFGMDPEEAVSVPRVHHQWVPEVLFVDEGVSGDTTGALEGRGHTVETRQFGSSVQVVHFVDGSFEGASDPRKGGRPASPGVIAQP